MATEAERKTVTLPLQHYGDHRIYLPPAVDFDCCSECNRRTSGYVAWPCEPARLMAGADAAEARAAELAEKIEAALDEHEPVGPLITGIPPTCPSCGGYDPCATKVALSSSATRTGETG